MTKEFEGYLEITEQHPQVSFGTIGVVVYAEDGECPIELAKRALRCAVAGLVVAEGGSFDLVRETAKDKEFIKYCVSNAIKESEKTA